MGNQRTELRIYINIKEIKVFSFKDLEQSN